jgi:putative transposase
LKKLSGKQRRFQADTNHRIAKELVCKAKDTNRSLAIEDLTHMRKRTTVKKGQRARHSNWAFFQLRSFTEYKGKVAGVMVIKVDPRNTSRRYSACGHCEKGNRNSQSEFVCKVCHYSINADYNGALNIRCRAMVNKRMVSHLQTPAASL